jgi:hypothetical protein
MKNGFHGPYGRLAHIRNMSWWWLAFAFLRSYEAVILSIYKPVAAPGGIRQKRLDCGWWNGNGTGNRRCGISDLDAHL